MRGSVARAVPCGAKAPARRRKTRKHGSVKHTCHTDSCGIIHRHARGVAVIRQRRECRLVDLGRRITEYDGKRRERAGALGIARLKPCKLALKLLPLALERIKLKAQCLGARLLFGDLRPVLFVVLYADGDSHCSEDYQKHDKY